MIKIQTTREKRLWLTVMILLFLTISVIFVMMMKDREADVAFVLETDMEQGAMSFLYQQERIEEQQILADPVEQEENDIMVDVKGAVERPGVYTLQEGDRIQAAIDAAGGLTEEGTTRTINLAQKLSDGMVIYVPTVEEIESDPNPSAPVPPLTGIDDPGNPQGKVKINSATVDQLKTLPGIGPSKAKAIVEYRQAHGLFQQIDDLLNVSGIGTKTLEQIRDLIEL